MLRFVLLMIILLAGCERQYDMSDYPDFPTYGPRDLPRYKTVYGEPHE